MAIVKTNQIPFAKTLVIALIDQTRNGEVNWVPNTYLSSNTDYHYDLKLDNGTRIDCKLELDDQFNYRPNSGWFNIKNPNLSEDVLVVSNYVPELNQLHLEMYDKYIRSKVQSARDTAKNDLFILEDIANKTGIQYVRDRKLEGLLGPIQMEKK